MGRWCLLLLCLLALEGVAEPLVIAHRGASGHLPEHTLAAYALAYGQGADYLEPDVVVTADGQAVALHDLYLDAVSDVRVVYPGRARADGLHYVVDFTLAELRGLNFRERIEPDSGAMRYPGRFPSDSGRFGIVTLAEVIELTQNLNRSTGRRVGIYPELKAAAFHAAEGHDIAEIVLSILTRYGYSGPDDGAIVQSFEPEPLLRLRQEFHSRLPLVQLLGESDWEMNAVDYEPMYSPRGLAEIATYADGIGPPWGRILTGFEGGSAQVSELVRDAQALGLVVHPYTFRADVLPAGVTFEELLGLFLADIGVDGVFTDHPDRVVAWVRLMRRQNSSSTP